MRNDPAKMAKTFAEAGLHRLHVVDLDGAKAGEVQNIAALKNIRKAVDMKIDFGGGLKSIAAMESVLEAGADFITLGSIAAENPALLQEGIDLFGPGRFFIGADVLDERIKTGGWLQDSGRMLIDFLNEMTGLGVNYFFCTDISKDGMMAGPAIALYSKILDSFPDIKLVASGGVTSIEDIQALKNAGCSGAIVGKAIYENLVSLPDLVNISYTQNL